jgi:eukaryotic-like serine/threonine-protein kinase
MAHLNLNLATAIRAHLEQCVHCSVRFRELHGRSPRTAHDRVKDQAALAETVINRDTQEIDLSVGSKEPQAPAELLQHPRYRILGVLGADGMGMVFKAYHRFMERCVALKVIHPRLVGQPGMAERFHREVRAAAALHHPNIVQAYDAERYGEVHFLVLELVEGEDLERRVEREGALTVGAACEVVRQTALGLGHALLRGMVHRDIKPHNLMVTAQGQIKILDFGLARVVSEQMPSILAEGSLAPIIDINSALTHVPLTVGTAVGWALGTPDYLAPEEAIDARSADIRADIYSLGCTLYRLLSGQAPFPGLIDPCAANVS